VLALASDCKLSTYVASICSTHPYLGRPERQCDKNQAKPQSARRF
jgi:hypothetical protein